MSYHLIIVIFPIISGSNEIPLPLLLESYIARDHPLVRKGEVTAEEDFAFFHGFFNEVTNPNKIVTEEELCTFYAGILF